MIVLVSLVVLLRELLVSHYFSHGASLHRHSFSRMIFTLVSHIFIASHRNAVMCMRTLAPRLVLLRESKMA